MAKAPSLTELPAIRIAFFGDTEAGKTTLVAAYYGHQQRYDFEKLHGYRLHAAPDTSNELLSKFFGMQQNGTFPAATGKRCSYSFLFKVNGLSRPAFAVDWLDYPGGWWSRMPSLPEEQKERHECIQALLSAHVGFLLVDGARYKDDGVAYVKRLLGQFQKEALGIEDLVQDIKGSKIPFIEEWVIALTKADLHSDLTAEQFAVSLLMEAHEEIAALRQALGGIGERNLGSRFMLLSAATVQPDDRNRVASVESPLGLAQIAPVAFFSILQGIADEQRQRDDKPNGWTKVVLWVARIAGKLALEKLVPPRYRTLTLMLRALGSFIGDIVEGSVEDYRKQQRQAAQDGKQIDAAVATMQAELVSDEARRVVYEA